MLCSDPALRLLRPLRQRQQPLRQPVRERPAAGRLLTPFLVRLRVRHSPKLLRRHSPLPRLESGHRTLGIRRVQPCHRGDLGCGECASYAREGSSGTLHILFVFRPRRFAVFIFIRGFYDIRMVEVYTSDTREWISMPSGWGDWIRVFGGERYVFLNDTLHFIAYDSEEDTFDSEGITIRSIVTVDKYGNTWRTIPQPPKVDFTFIGQSLGCLYGMQIDHGNGCLLSVWALENYASGQWTLKHTANILELLERPCLEHSEHYTLVAIHPEHNLIFLSGGVESEQTLMSYDMDTHKLHIICTLGDYGMLNFQPYIPCFAEWPSDAH